MTFQAFFDETDSQRGDRVNGVAACIFSTDGYDAFKSAWSPRVAQLKKPFHMAACYGGGGEFGLPPWDRPSRKELWTDLGRLIVRTRRAGVVCFITQSDYNKFLQRSPSAGAVIGSPYSLCLLFCALLVGDFAKSQGEDVVYSFESGAPKMKEASDFVNRAISHKTVKEYLRVKGHSFVEKAYEPTLCAADYLAWGWQRSWHEDGWHESIEIVRSDKSRPLYISQINSAKIGVQAMFNMFYGLSPYRD